MKPDFSGWATKNDILCSDGRTIRKNAFAHQDKTRVPLIWKHNTDSPENVLGYAELTNREEGVYADAYFNQTPNALIMKEAVAHGDVRHLSIFANKLKQKGADVIGGMIRELSLVPTGANPGAVIETVSFAHGQDVEYDSAIIYTDEELIHEDPSEDVDEKEEKKEEDEAPTFGEVFDTLNDQQKEVVYALIGEALTHKASDNADTENTPVEGESVSHEDNTLPEGNTVKHNVFDQDASVNNDVDATVFEAVLRDAKKMGSMRDAFLAHADDLTGASAAYPDGSYGIDKIEYLFPDARVENNTPTFIKRRTEWVDRVLSATQHSPFSRVKMVHADITAEDARARGFLKGNVKKEEIFKLLKRSISPTTIYKKQTLDRDDVLDITDLDVVAWMKGEMRVMLDEEVASCVLVGDGRESDDPDKVDPSKLIPIAEEHVLYAPRAVLTAPTVSDFIDGITTAMADYEGSGSPELYIRQSALIRIKVQRNPFGDRIYKTDADLAAEAGVSRVIPIPDAIMDRAIAYTANSKDYSLQGVIVNLTDYRIGADDGAKLGMFDDFDIDYNQMKYLLETRISGALTKAKSAVRIYSDAAIVNNPTPVLVTTTEPTAP